MRLLTLCFPTFGKDNHLHLASDGKKIVLAPDQFHAELLKAGWTVDVVSLAPPSQKRLFCSGLPLHTAAHVAGQAYDLVWHMFRDPTQPEVLAALKTLPSSLPCPAAPVNDAFRLVHHHKLHYLPILARHGLALPIVDVDPPGIDWQLSSGAFVDLQQGLISTQAYNNNRGDYPSRGHGRITLHYIDNSVNGLRSFVRFGMAFGRGFSGCEYFSRQLAFRSGEAEQVRPYRLPQPRQAPLARALAEMGCDVCHVEAVIKDERLFVFDVNPYPTSHGKTLTDITRALIPCFQERVRGG